MTNTPFLPRHADFRRPARNDRLGELSAFHLGYEPYALWYEFIVVRSPSPSPSCREWLLDLPLQLRQSLGSYDWERFNEVIRCAIAAYESFSSDRTIITTRPTLLLSDEEGQVACESARRSEDDVGPTSTDTEPPIGMSERDAHSFHCNVYGPFATPGHNLIRIARGLGNSLPGHMQNWFRLGETLGRCLWYTTESYGDRDIGNEVLIAVGDTELDPQLLDPSQDDSENDADVVPDWGPQAVGEFAREVDAYLEDQPRIVLRAASHFLWFLGAPVRLTPVESRLLTGIAGCATDVVTREYLLRQVLDDPEINNHKPDQYVQQVVNKMAKALHDIHSLYYRQDDSLTRAWLRAEFLISVPKAGWRRGPLMQRMVVE
jgi:hypothetical protein